MSTPGFVITGCGRSGTKYVAHVLRACGVDAGHEDWFYPGGPRRSGLDGDVSWLAVPALEARAWAGPTVLVTRHPVACVRSLVGTWFLTADGSPHTAFALEHEPELAELPPVERAVEWWVRWNTRAARLAELTVPVETFTLPRVLGEVAAVIGHQLDPAAAASVPTDVHHGRQEDIPAGEIWRLLDGRATAFGYAPHTETKEE
jgi:hypothetical protein